jgi:hypothetical protein
MSLHLIMEEILISIMCTTDFYKRLMRISGWKISICIDHRLLESLTTSLNLLWWNQDQVIWLLIFWNPRWRQSSSISNSSQTTYLLLSQAPMLGRRLMKSLKTLSLGSRMNLHPYIACLACQWTMAWVTQAQKRKLRTIRRLLREGVVRSSTHKRATSHLIKGRVRSVIRKFRRKLSRRTLSTLPKKLMNSLLSW